MKKLFLVDAYALIFRYYYAFIGRPMRNAEGMNTSVIFGFVKFLRDIQRREHPDLLGVAFDPAGGSFRRELSAEYKANRAETPEDIIASVPYIKRILEAMCIPILELPRYEADDVIGTLSKKGVEAGYEVFMVTPDKDYGQLVGEKCKIYRQRGKDGEVEIIDREAIEAKYGISDPKLVADILAIWGDAADNIKGVAGIGEKGAMKLVQQWGAVENIIENVSQISGKQGESIAASVDALRLSKTLTQIALDAPIEFNAEALTVCGADNEALKKIFLELNFTSFIRELAQTTELKNESGPISSSTPKPAPKSSGIELQGDLFGAPIEPSVAEPMGQSEKMWTTADSTPHQYTLVDSQAELLEVISVVGQYDEFCFDTETTGLDIFNSQIVGLSIAVEPHKAWYIPLPSEVCEERIGALKPLFEDATKRKIGQNLKFDIMVLRRLGVRVNGIKYDTMILHYLLDAESRHNMDALAMKYLNYKPIEIEALIGKGARQTTMDRVAVERVKEYAAEDAEITLQLKNVLLPLVEEGSLMELYLKVEEPMIDVLAEMELTGVKIDVRALNDYSTVLINQLAQLEHNIREQAQEPNLNINSPKQLGEMLFVKMQIDPKPRKTKSGQYSTDEEYLLTFAKEHTVVAMILEYRGLKKLLSTYVQALPQLVNHTTGRVHTSYNQAVTATGRLSSTNPNLQNIPIRDAVGRPIREAFIPSDSERTLLSADYSQVELRLMAHLSGDESLLADFRAGADIHAATAAKLFGKSIEDVSPEERRRAKTANFGIIYGISAFGLSQRLDIPRSEAKELIDGYFAAYPKVKAYMERVVERAREVGYVETLFGRRRYLHDISSRNAIARGVAERNAINAPIQGTAADIMKLAMIKIHNEIERLGLQSRVTMQVHDELVVDTLLSEKDSIARIVVDSMQGAASLDVDLLVEYGVGDNWLKAH